MTAPNESRNEKPIRWQISIQWVLGVIFGALVMGVGMYNGFRDRMHDAEIKISLNTDKIERRDATTDKEFEKLNAKLDMLQTSIYDLKFQLEKKQDKK